MIHPCVACPLRFATTGELRDHVVNDHTEQPPLAVVSHPVRRTVLTPDDYSRSGWARLAAPST